MYVLGYLPAASRVYLADKENVIVSYKLRLSVLEYVVFFFFFFFSFLACVWRRREKINQSIPVHLMAEAQWPFRLDPSPCSAFISSSFLPSFF
jgi:hypothetical protein